MISETTQDASLPNVTIDYTYDARDLIRADYTIGGTPSFGEKYGHDDLDNLTVIRQFQTGNGGGEVRDKTIVFGNNLIGQYDRLTRYTTTGGSNGSGGTSTEVAHTDYGYDSANRLTGITHKKSDAGSTSFV